MALSQPDRVRNHGDAQRVVEAVAALLEILLEDFRVLEQFPAWKHRRSIDAHMQRMWAEPSQATFDAFFDGVLHEDRAELLELRRFVREDLGLPYPWLGRRLLEGFQLACRNQAHPEHPEAGRLWVPACHRPAGRKPPRDAASIREGVRWLYRSETKQPRDYVHELEHEYAEKAGRSTEAHSVIHNGITQAKALLALALDTDPELK